MAQANAQIGVAQAAFYPERHAERVGGIRATRPSPDWFTWPSRFWSVGPALAETLFDGGLRRATVQQFQAAYDQTVANYRQTVLTAFQQVEDNLAALRILSQEIQQQDAAVSLARSETCKSPTTRYRAGIDPYLNVITAQTTLAQQSADRGESAQAANDRQRAADRGARRRLGRLAPAADQGSWLQHSARSKQERQPVTLGNTLTARVSQRSPSRPPDPPA